MAELAKSEPLVNAKNCRWRSFESCLPQRLQPAQTCASPVRADVRFWNAAMVCSMTDMRREAAIRDLAFKRQLRSKAHVPGSSHSGLIGSMQSPLWFFTLLTVRLTRWNCRSPSRFARSRPFAGPLASDQPGIVNSRVEDDWLAIMDLAHRFAGGLGDSRAARDVELLVYAQSPANENA